MWKVTTTNLEEGVVSATATEDSGFSWNAIIKEGDTSFVEVAKKEFAAHLEKHKDDLVFALELEALLNKDQP